MARRLFSSQIVDSDAFLDMSASAQNLYFHLGMRADDDGFVDNPKKISRICGANDDDLKILIVKRFVLAFESGVVVIKHWLIHNSIRKDRYHETKYLEEKSSLVLKDNGSYTEKNGHSLKLRQPNGNQMATQVKLSKVKLNNNAQQKLSDDATKKQFDIFWTSYPRKVSKKKSEQMWNRLKPNEETFKKIMTALEAYKISEQWKRDKQFIPHPATWLYQERFNDELPAAPPKQPFYKGLKMKQFDGKWKVWDRGQWNEYGGKLSEIEYR